MNAMTANRFIKELAEEVKENGWGDLPIVFVTSSSSKDLFWLSVYDSDGGDKLYMDIGDE